MVIYCGWLGNSYVRSEYICWALILHLSSFQLLTLGTVDRHGCPKDIFHFGRRPGRTITSDFKLFQLFWAVTHTCEVYHASSCHQTRWKLSGLLWHERGPWCLPGFTAGHRCGPSTASGSWVPPAPSVGARAILQGACRLWGHGRREGNFTLRLPPPDIRNWNYSGDLYIVPKAVSASARFCLVGKRVWPLSFQTVFCIFSMAREMAPLTFLSALLNLEVSFMDQ